MDATDYLVWGIVIHLVCDWIFQNEWIAVNKVSLRHGASWLHGFIHSAGMMLIFSPLVALLIGLSHIIIDLRFIMAFWRKVFRQTTAGMYAVPVAVWGDQTAHIVIIAFAALMIG